MLKPSYINFVKPYMTEPINSTSEAIDFILKLHLDRKLWHFDDDPADFVDNKTHQPAFTEFEVLHLRDRQVELFKHLEDPFEIPVSILKSL